MSKLLLLRHAEARVVVAGSDCERPLTESGRIEALRLGDFCLRAELVPDEAIVSPALRTRETYTELTKAFAKKPAVSFEPALYNAPSSCLLSLIQQVAAKIETLLIVAHNPGLAELANFLAQDNGPDEAAVTIMRQYFPTPALAVIEFKNTDWSEISAGTGALEYFITSLTLDAWTKIS
jgi:phosphohistidine phosphatase